MGKHIERAQYQYANAAQWCLYANLAITAACLFDYFVQQREWALLSLALYIVLINGGVLLMRHFEIRAARQRDIEDEPPQSR